MTPRPSVSVVIPFAGTLEDARRLLGWLEPLERRAGDELIVVDNSPEPVFERAGGLEGLTVVRAADEHSSYHARNVGAAVAQGEWLLFFDADCEPLPSLLDAYFDPPPGARCGALGGGIVGAPEQEGLLAQWARARGVLDQRHSLSDPFRPYIYTGNALVRRAAYDDVTGFVEGVRSGGDADFGWRLDAAGWQLESRPQAAIAHHHRETVRRLVAQASRYGSGAAWLERRYPDCPPQAPRARIMLRAAAASLAHTLLGRFERGAFQAVDLLFYLGQRWGHPRSNAVAGSPDAVAGKRSVRVESVACASEFPIAALGPDSLRDEEAVRVEALRRSNRPRAPEARGLPVTYLEDDSYAERIRSAALLAVLHPLRVARFWRSRRSFAGGPGDAVTLRALAPAARRVARSGARLTAADPGAERWTESLAILRASVRWRPSGGTPGSSAGR